MLVLCYPKCTTCQKALAWLDAHGLSYEIRNIKEQNPTEEELRAWHAKSGLPLRRFFNTSGLLYKGFGLKEKLPCLAFPLDQLPQEIVGSLESSLGAACSRWLPSAGQPEGGDAA